MWVLFKPEFGKSVVEASLRLWLPSRRWGVGRLKRLPIIQRIRLANNLDAWLEDSGYGLDFWVEYVAKDGYFYSTFNICRIDIN